jgi:acetylornithine deacetylase/succinyl-diaminopimelate desuccinylase-like protein
VLLYAHYDVQPAGGEELWESPPYKPTVRNGRLFGRGAADDKAGIVAHLGALLALGSDSPVGVKLLIEGAEETGSAGLEAYMPAHPDLAAADAVFVCDNGNVALGTPTLTTSLRGLASFDVTVETLAAPVHSGSYGGVAPDALVALIRLLATLHDERGRTAVEGLATLPYEGTSRSEEEFRADAGVLAGVDLLGDGSLAGRLMTGPAINVIGMDVPDVASATNAVIAKARARVSVRVAPSQDPAEAAAAVARHLEAHVPWHVKATIAPVQTGRGYLALARGPGQRLARWALEEAYGRVLIESGDGGSIPLMAAFHAAAPAADLVLLGAADPTSNVHAPNESVDLGELERCTLAQALYLAGLAAGDR